MAKLKNNIWLTTCERYVGFIDIMGFKDMVMKLSHESIYEMMKKIDDAKTLNENISWTKITGKLVRTTNYSDSIMIYSKDNSYDSLFSFICTISAMLGDLFIENIPFKGAISFGKMTLDTDRSIFFGQPLIDSFLLQEELNFYGVIVHATAEKEILKFGTKTRALFLTEYLCPLKFGSSYHLTIHPMTSDHYLDSEEDAKEYENLLLSINQLRLRTSGHLRKYIDNTEVYIKFVRNNGRSSVENSL